MHSDSLLYGFFNSSLKQINMLSHMVSYIVMYIHYFLSHNLKNLVYATEFLSAISSKALHHIWQVIILYFCTIYKTMDIETVTVALLYVVVVCVLLLIELVAGLRDQRLPDGTTDSVGQVLMDWVWLSTAVIYCRPTHVLYIIYVLNQLNFNAPCQNFHFLVFS